MYIKTFANYRIVPKKMCIEPIDIELQLLHETNIAQDFDGYFFDIIPSNELVNIDVLVEERWLEDNPYLSSEFKDELKFIRVKSKIADEKALVCGPLENLVLQIKFCDNMG